MTRFCHFLFILALTCLTSCDVKKFSRDFNADELLYLHPNLLICFAHLSKFCLDNYIPLHLTSGIRPIIDGISKSSTHQSGRAADIRIMYWDKKQLQDVLRFISGFDHTEKIGAISSRDGIRRLAYVHKNHLHLQVSP